MKRDLDLIRKMLFAVEETPSGWAPELGFEGYTDAQVAYHAYLLVDAGLAQGLDFTSAGSDGPEWQVQYLTWAGHEFAEAARDNTRWNKALSLVKEKGGAITVALLTELLTNLMKRSLGMP